MDDTAEKIKEIGKRIKALREARGMDQKTLAWHVGVTRASISAYECGTRCPKMKHVDAMADALGVESTQIITEAERAKIMEAENARRDEAAALGRLRRHMEQEQAHKQEGPVWMDEARRVAVERAAAGGRRRRRAQEEPETGATSGFIAYSELAGLPEFLREVVCDQHIRRMLWLCGAYGRLGSVKKTRTPLGIAWTAEEDEHAEVKERSA
ncbi:MAG: helix-turn-helix transcriptional regulator [Clostridiales bacterium]|nr:helix-turn-helix transcriptional regulator [Clostridiales bacterium]